MTTTTTKAQTEFCPHDGNKLVFTWEKNRWYVSFGLDSLEMGEDYDTETGERLALLLASCPVQRKCLFGKCESHYTRIIRTDVKESQKQQTL